MFLGKTNREEEHSSLRERALTQANLGSHPVPPLP